MSKRKTRRVSRGSSPRPRKPAQPRPSSVPSPATFDHPPLLSSSSARAAAPVPSAPPSPALCAKEAAAALGVHLQTVYKALRCGGLKGSKIGSRWRISRAGFDQALRDGIATDLQRQEAEDLAAAG